jgi:hypothetical protein
MFSFGSTKGTTKSDKTKTKPKSDAEDKKAEESKPNVYASAALQAKDPKQGAARCKRPLLSESFGLKKINYTPMKLSPCIKRMLNDGQTGFTPGIHKIKITSLPVGGWTSNVCGGPPKCTAPVVNTRLVERSSTNFVFDQSSSKINNKFMCLFGHEFEDYAIVFHLQKFQAIDMLDQKSV